MKNIGWKKILTGIVWSLIGIGVFVLMAFAMNQKDKRVCSNVDIEITGSEKEMFIDENDVLDLINSNGNVMGKSISKINLRLLEAAIEKNIWVKNAELYFDNNQVLHINIEERKPVARVFTEDGSSFYVDSTALRLPLSEKLSAQVPVFTGFASNRDTLASSDSVMLHNIVNIGKYILADSFWTAQVQQVNIKPDATFEIIPSIGNQIIELGNAENIDRKFKNLYTFYKKVWLQSGIDKYEKLDAQFSNQIVAVKRTSLLKGVDTLMNKAIVDSAAMKDSVHIIKPLLQGIKKKSGAENKAYKSATPLQKSNKPKAGNKKIRTKTQF